MKVPTVFKILNNPVWMCKLKDKAKKKKKVFVSDYRRSYDRQEKKCKQTFGLNHVKQCIL